MCHLTESPFVGETTQFSIEIALHIISQVGNLLTYFMKLCFKKIKAFTTNRWARANLRAKLIKCFVNSLVLRTIVLKC